MTDSKLTPEQEAELQSDYAFHISEGGQLTWDQFCEISAKVDDQWLTRDPAIMARIDRAIIEDDTLLPVLRELLAAKGWRR